MSDEYYQSVLDETNKQQSEQKFNDIRNRVISKLNKYEEVAVNVLAECSLTPDDVRDYSASVSGHGYFCVGSLPEQLHSIFSDYEDASVIEQKERELSDKHQRAWIAASILALCRLARYGCNPVKETDPVNLESLSQRSIKGWDLFIIAEALVESMEALRDPEKQSVYINKKLKAYGRDGGKKGKLNREQPRYTFNKKIKIYIQSNHLWNDATNTIQSITNNLWNEVKASVKEKGEWQGLQIDLQKSRIGRQTVYDAVSETAPD